MTGNLNDLFASMVGERMPGGCDDCDAHQTLAADGELVGAFMLTVHHDDSCPFLRGQVR